MDGTSQARIERVDRAQYLQRHLRISYWCADQGGFVGPHLPVRVARTGVPWKRTCAAQPVLEFDDAGRIRYSG